MAIGALALAGCSAGPTVPGTPVITLGQLTGAFRYGAGFGVVKPSVISNGGDGTGIVSRVAWKSWGGVRAIATGVAEYVGPGQYPATGADEPATVVAFKLGACDGKAMYQAVEWYFPQHGQSFDPNQYENICIGSYVTTTTTASTCSPAQITARHGQRVGGATGERAMLITLTNRGTRRCLLEGYPRVRLLTSAGTILNLPQFAQTLDYVTSARPRPVLLDVGATAYVLVAKYRCDIGDLKEAAAARITLPGTAADTALRVVMGSTSPGLALCKGGPTDPGNVINVTPVESTLAGTVP